MGPSLSHGFLLALDELDYLTVTEYDLDDEDEEFLAKVKGIEPRLINPLGSSTLPITRPCDR